MIAKTDNTTAIICFKLVFSLKYKTDSKNALIVPKAEVVVVYTVRDISCIANTEITDETLDISVLIITFDVVFKLKGRTISFSGLRRKRANIAITNREITTIITLVSINSDPESVAVLSSVKSFKTMGLAPEIKKNARHMGIVAGDNFPFVPKCGIIDAITIETTDIIIVTVGSLPRKNIVNNVERMIDPLVESMFTSDTETNL